MNNEFEATEKFNRGKRDEELFYKSVCYSLGYEVPYRESTIKEDRYGADMYINNIPIDVKGKKSVGVFNLNDDVVTILERFDSDGNLGWLYKNSILIAFRRYFVKDFILIPRELLVDFYHSRINENTPWSENYDGNDSLYKRHRRMTSKEEMTAVLFEDLLKLKWVRRVKIPQELLDTGRYEYTLEDRY